MLPPVAITDVAPAECTVTDDAAVAVKEEMPLVMDTAPVELWRVICVLANPVSVASDTGMLAAFRAITVLATEAVDARNDTAPVEAPVPV